MSIKIKKNKVLGLSHFGTPCPVAVILFDNRYTVGISTNLDIFLYSRVSVQPFIGRLTRRHLSFLGSLDSRQPPTQNALPTNYSIQLKKMESQTDQKTECFSTNECKKGSQA